jgi:hypothetical protein
LLFTQFKNGYLAQINCEKYKAILAPEQMVFFLHRCKNLKMDSQKVDVFQLGICIVCVLSGASFEEYFDYAKGEYKSQKA